MNRWILVVEDESALGEMICDNLRMAGYDAELCSNGRLADERISRGGIDLVILDVMLPELGGFEILANMRKREDSTPVLILSALGRDQDRIQGLELHADDYLTKPFNLKELLLRVAALLRRHNNSEASPTVAFGGNEVDLEALHVTNFAGDAIKLTANEAKLLRLLTAREGQVLARRELVDHLFGAATSPTTRSLDNIVLSLRRSLERDSKTPRHIHTVRGIGLRFTTEKS